MSPFGRGATTPPAKIEPLGARTTDVSASSAVPRSVIDSPARGPPKAGSRAPLGAKRASRRSPRFSPLVSPAPRMDPSRCNARARMDSTMAPASTTTLPPSPKPRVDEPVGQVAGQGEVVGPHDATEAATGVAAAAEHDAPVRLEHNGVRLVVGLVVEVGRRDAAHAEPGIESTVGHVARHHEVALRPQRHGVVVRHPG